MGGAPWRLMPGGHPPRRFITASVTRRMSSGSGPLVEAALSPEGGRSTGDSAAFSGAGDTLPAMFLGLPMTLLRIPAVTFAARFLGYGVPGVFWAVTITAVARGLMFAFWFARGKWVHAKA